MISAVLLPGRAHAGDVDLDAASQHGLHRCEGSARVVLGGLGRFFPYGIADRYHLALRMCLVDSGVPISYVPYADNSHS